jgi:two-component system, sensor histidine kinase and response regulator
MVALSAGPIRRFMQSTEVGFRLGRFLPVIVLFLFPDFALISGAESSAENDPIHQATPWWVIPWAVMFCGLAILPLAVGRFRRMRQETRLMEQYRLIVDNVGEVILVMDLNLRYVFASPSVFRLYGYTPEEFIARPLDRILSPESLKDAMAAFEEEMALEQTGTADPGRCRVMESLEFRKDRSRVWVENTLSFIRDADSKLLRVLCISKDITERKRVDAELARTRDAALESTRIKSEFLANMSHEIRTPMNGVMGMTEMLLDTTLTAEQRDYAETIEKCSSDLLAIINDILDLSKIEAGHLTFETVDFNLVELIQDTIGLETYRARAKGLKLFWLVEPSVPTLLQGDPGRLRQVLSNLLSNAVKFTQKGDVSVSVTGEGSGGDEATLRFSVRDTGIGVSPELRPYLFQPFTQGDNSMTRQFGGTGLGLVISKRIVEGMEGRIDFESTPGRGSDFWFTATFALQPGAGRDQGVLDPLRSAQTPGR